MVRNFCLVVSCAILATRWAWTRQKIPQVSHIHFRDVLAEIVPELISQIADFSQSPGIVPVKPQGDSKIDALLISQPHLRYVRHPFRANNLLQEFQYACLDVNMGADDDAQLVLT